MPVTLDQVQKISADFTTLLDDITALVPPSPQVQIALMMFKMAETAVLQLMQQHVIPLPGGTP